jgi:hypothetical protein
MRLRTAWLLLGLCCCGPAADAAWFHRDSLPTPKDYPYPPPRSLDRRPKPGAMAQHSKYQDPNWGRETKKAYREVDSHLPHSIR